MRVRTRGVWRQFDNNWETVAQKNTVRFMTVALFFPMSGNADLS